MANRYLVGDNDNGGVVAYGENENYIWFRERNAGSYSVVIVGTDNPNYLFDQYLEITWTINKRNVVYSAASTGSSSTFGDINYGRLTLTFSNIVAGDKIKINNVSVNNICRYSTLTADTEIVNSAYYVYGSSVGEYTLTLSDVVTVGDTSSGGRYGESFGNNYYFSSADGTYSSKWSILPRTLSVSEYVLTDSDYVYNYNVAKGVKIEITNFYSSGFFDEDVNPSVIDRDLIVVEYTASGCVVNREVNRDTNGKIIMYFKAYDAGVYAITVEGVSYVDGGISYNNYQLTPKSGNFTISPKTVNIQWFLDGADAIASGNSVIYDKTLHTVRAGFLVAKSGTFSTSDYLVYYNDYDALSGKITLTKEGEKNTLIQYTGTVEAVNVSSAADEIYIAVASQLSGNYRINDSVDVPNGKGQSFSWQIQRKTIDISFTNPGDTFIYDGQQHGLAINISGLCEGDVLSGFAENGVNFVTNAEFNSASNSFLAVNAGTYTLTIDNSAGVKIDVNYVLYASFDDYLLFTVAPRVVTVAFNTVSATYSASEVDFDGTLTNVVAGDDLAGVFTYVVKTPTGSWITPGQTVTSILNAGVYTVTLSGLLNNDYGNYTMTGGSGYSTDCTLNRKVVSVNPEDIHLPDIVFDGMPHGVALTEVDISPFLLEGAINDDKNGTYRWSGQADYGKVAVGMYSLSITGISANMKGELNYVLAAVVEKNWSIVPRQLSLSYSADDYIYGDEAMSFTLTVGNLVGTEGAAYFAATFDFVLPSGITASPVVYSEITQLTDGNFVIKFDITEAGVYTVRLNSANNSNYSLPTSGLAKTWTVEARIIEIEWSGTTYVYDAAYHGPTASVTNLVSGDTVTPVYGGVYSAKDAGNYTASVTGIDSANYRIVGSLTVDWNISPKPLDVASWQGSDGTFNGLIGVYDGSSKFVTAIPSGVCGNDTVVFTYDPSLTVGAVLAGSYTTGISGVNNNNYTVSEIAEEDGKIYCTWSVSPRTLFIAWEDYSFNGIYNGASQGKKIIIENVVTSDYGSNLVFGKEIVVAEGYSASITSGSPTVADGVYVNTFTARNAGKYALSIFIDDSSARKDCYVLQGDVSAEWQIAPRSVTLAWTLDGDLVSSKEYNGAVHVAQATVSDKALATDDVEVLGYGGSSSDGVLIDGNKAVIKGNYLTAVTSLSNANYTLEGASGLNFEWSITARQINISWTGNAYTYNGQYQAPSLTVTRLISTDEVLLKTGFYLNSVSESNLLSYASLLRTGSTQYTFTSSDADYRKTLNAGQYYAVFDAAIYYADGTVNENYRFIGSNATYGYFIQKAILDATGVWTWTKGTQSGILGEKDLIYAAEEYVLTTLPDENDLFVRADTGVKDEVAFVYNDNTGISAGKHSASVGYLSGTFAENYSVGSGTSVAWEILPKPVNPVWSGHGGLVYKGANFTVQASFLSGAASDDDGLIYDGDTLNVNSYGGTRTALSAGTYSVTVLTISSADYTLEGDLFGNNSLTWTINPLPVILSWNASEFTYDGTEKTVVCEISNKIGGDKVSVTASDGVFSAINAGTYSAEVLAVDNPDYIVFDNSAGQEYVLADGTVYPTAATEAVHSWQIRKAKLIFDFVHPDLVYDGTFQGMRLSIRGLANSDLVAKSVSFVTGGTAANAVQTNTGTAYYIDYSAVDAGSYTCSVQAIEGVSASNYSLPSNLSDAFIIDKLPVVVSWNYVAPFVYDGTQHAVTPTVDNTVINEGNGSSDTVVPTVNNSVKKAAGIYVAEVVSVSNLNYTIVGGSGISLEWRILARELTVTGWTFSNLSASGTVGVDDIVYNGTAYTLTAIVANGVAGENIAFRYTDNEKTYAGNYSSTVELAVGNGNYVWSETSVNSVAWEIEKLKVAPTWGDDTFIYDGQEHVLSATASNKVLTDTVSFVYEGTVVSGSGTIEGNKACDAGVYSVTLIAVLNENYTVEGVENNLLSHTLTINPRTLSVTFGNAQLVYNGQKQGIYVSIGNFVSADLGSVTIDKFVLEAPGCEISGAADGDVYKLYFAAVRADRYHISVIDYLDENYVLTAADEYFEIDKRILSVSGWEWSDGENSGSDVFEFVYSGKTVTLTPVTENVVEGETVVLQTQGNSYSDAGNYTARASLDTVAYPDYSMTAAVRSWRITPLEVGVEWKLDGEDVTSVVYDGKTHRVTATAIGLIEGDVASISVSEAQKTNAGQYVSTCVSISGVNYVLPQNGTEFAWEIEKRTVTLEWNVDGIATSSAEYDGELHSATALITNAALGDTVSVETYSGTVSEGSGTVIDGNSAYDVSVYRTVAVSLSDEVNYRLETNEDLRSFEWSIVPIVLSFLSSGGEFVYDGGNLGITVTVSKIVPSDLDGNRITFLYEGSDVPVVNGYVSGDVYVIEFKASQAADYSAAVSAIAGVSASNYGLPDEKAWSFTIKQRPVEISWAESGEDIYNRNYHTRNATVSNLVAGDEAVLTYSTTGSGYSSQDNRAVDAGNYITTVTGVSNGNYTVDKGVGLSCAWTILPKEISVNNIYWKQGGTDLFDVEYNSGAFTVTAHAYGGASNDSDGLVYDGDTVGFTYRGEVTEQYGLSALSNNNTAVNAGRYEIFVTGTDNGNYSVSGTPSTELYVAKRSVTSSFVKTGSGVYDGKTHGYEFTFERILNKAYIDNIVSVELNGDGLTVGERSVLVGERYTVPVTAENAGDYSFAVGLNPDVAESANYYLEELSYDFTVAKKEITCFLGQNTFEYVARGFTSADMAFTFGGLVSGEKLTLGSDFEATFSDGTDVVTPYDAGVYTVSVALKDTPVANNYSLLSAETEFMIVPRTLSAEDFVWQYVAVINEGGELIPSAPIAWTWGNGLVFDSDTVHSFALQTDDEVFLSDAGNVEFTLNYFGFCNCGLESDAGAVYHDHQLTYGGTGPHHAGSYYLVVSLSGTKSANYVLPNSAYPDVAYFVEQSDGSYKVGYPSAPTEFWTDVPALSKGGRNLAYLLGFTVGRANASGFEEVEGDAFADRVFEGKAFTDIRPALGENADTSKIYVRVSTENDVETSGKYVEYTWQAYLDTGLRNAGTYKLLFMMGDETIISGTSCDLMHGTVPSVSINFTVLKADLSVSAVSGQTGVSGFTKIYDGLDVFDSFTLSATAANEGREPVSDILSSAPVTVKAVFTEGKNVGNGKALRFTVSGSEAVNYRIISTEGYEIVSDTEINATGNILAKEIALEPARDKTYDGETYFIRLISGNGIIDGDVVYLEGNYDAPDAGKRTVTLNILRENDGINYVLAETSQQATIVPKKLNVVWTGERNSIYDAEEKGLSVRVEGTVGEAMNYETVTLTYTFGEKTGQFITSSETGTGVYDFKAKDVGSYEIELGIADDGNYTLQGADYISNFVINAKEITVYFLYDELADGQYVYGWTVTDGKFVTKYSGRERSVTAFITEGDVCAGDDVSLSLEGNIGSDAAEYLAKVTSLTGVSANNYKLTGVLTQEWVIGKAPLEGLVFADLEAIYNGMPQGPVLNAETTQHGIAFNAVYSGGRTSTGVNGNNALTDVGSAEITVVISETVNYFGFTEVAEVIISPAEITGIVFEDKEFIYDGTERSVSVSSLVTEYGDTVKAEYHLTGTTSGNSPVEKADNGTTDAGVYNVTALLTNDNYNPLELQAELIINRRELSVAWSDTAGAEWVYNGLYQGKVLVLGNIIVGDGISVTAEKIFDGVTATENVVCDGSADNVSAEFTAKDASASQYLITLVSIGGERGYNYSLPSNVSSAFGIAKRELTVEKWLWTDGTDEGYDKSAFVYSGKEYRQEPVLAAANGQKGVIAGDEEGISLTLTDCAAVNAASYEAKASLNEHKNYFMATASFAWVIEPKVITVVWNSDTLKTYRASEQSVYAVVQGYIAGDNPSFIYNGNKATEASDDLLAEIIAIDDPNYALPEEGLTCEWSILPAVISGTELLGQNVVYDGLTHEISLTKAVTQFNEPITVSYTVSVMTEDGGFANEQEGHSALDAGTYKIKAHLDAGENYYTKDAEALLVIEKRIIELIWNNSSPFIYNSETQGVQLTFGNIIAGETFSAVVKSDSSVAEQTVTVTEGTEILLGATDAGEYRASVISVDDGNYALPENTESVYVINPKKAVFVWETDVLSGQYVTQWNGFSVEYCNRERSVYAKLQSGAATNDDGLIYDGDDVSVEVSGGSATKVGVYTATAVRMIGADGSNYYFDETEQLTVVYEITKATIFSILFTDKTVPYNATPYKIEVSSVETLYGDLMTVRYEGAVYENYGLSEINGNSAVNAGVYKVKAIIEETENYYRYEKEAYLTIYRANLSGIEFRDKTASYDTTFISVGESSYVTEYGDTIYPEYEITGTTASGVGYSAETNGYTEAGTYTVIASFGHTDIRNSNYAEGTLEVTLTINRADMVFAEATLTGGGEYVYKADYYYAEAVVVGSDGQPYHTQYGHPVTVRYVGGENASENGVRNAGTYTVSAILSGGNNYRDYTLAPIDIVIEPKEVEINLEEKTYVYNATSQNSAIIASFAFGGNTDDDGKIYDADKDIRFNFETEGTETNNLGEKSFLNAGSYRVTFAVAGNDNYTIKDPERTIIMEKADIDGFYLNGYIAEYNNSTMYIGVSEKADQTVLNPVASVRLYGSDSGAVEYFLDDGSGTYGETFTGALFAGKYDIKASIRQAGTKDNYNRAELYATITIEKTSLSGFALESQTVTFDGSEHALNFTCEPGQEADEKYYTRYGEELDFRYEISSDGLSYTDGNGAVNVNVAADGSVIPYYVKITFSLADPAREDSYTVESKIFTANLTITKATLSDIALEGKTVTYDGTEHTLEPTFASAPDGQYPRYVYENGNVRIILSREHNGGDGDLFVLSKDTDGLAAIDAGTYAFYVSVTPGEGTVETNYVPFSGLSAELVIERATMADANGIALSQGVNLFFNDISSVYNAGIQAILIGGTPEESTVTDTPLTEWIIHPSANPLFAETALVSYVYAGVAATGVTNADVYQVRAALLNKNYLPVYLDAVLEIRKAEIEYTLVGADIIYDEETHFVSVSPVSEPQYNDVYLTAITLLGTDTASVSYTYSSLSNGMGVFGGVKNADVYTVNAIIAVNGAAAANYVEKPVLTAVLTIEKFLTSVNWTYGAEYVFDGTDRGASVQAEFLSAKGQSVPMTVSFVGLDGKAVDRTDFRNAGNYTVKAAYTASDKNNYVFNNSETVLTILKADVELYLVGTSVTYSASRRYLLVNTVAASNVSATFVPGETDVITFCGEQLKIDYVYTPADKGVYGALNVGIYTVTADLNLGTGESNFNDWSSPKEAKFEILPKALTVTGSTLTKTYDGNTDCAIGVIDGLIYPDGDYILYKGVFSDKNVGANKDVTVILEVKNGYEDYAYVLDNYVVPDVGTGEILPKEIAASDAYDWTKTYDGNINSVHSPITLFAAGKTPVSGDDLTVTARYNSKNVMEANSILFSLSGADKDNYVIEDLSFDIDFTDTFLIYPRTAGITWINYTHVYTGTVLAAQAYFDLVGDDVTSDNRGRIYLDVTYTYVADGNGAVLDAPVHMAIYRNAGRYVADASGDNVGEETLANYGIFTTEKECVIEKADIVVNWEGLSEAKYVYNGTDQGENISASAVLLGDDVATYEGTEYLKADFGQDGKEFRNAGEYVFEAVFTQDATELNNNYNLTDNRREITMEKAEITNVSFHGSYGWTYSDGTTVYFYAAEINNAYGFSTGYVPLYYEYDSDIEIQFVYSGGHTSGANNGIRNAGTYVITASVAETENYKFWSESVTVTVSKGVIGDYITLVGYSTVYDMAYHYVYAGNNDQANPQFVEVRLPDGTTPIILYSVFGSYYNPTIDEMYDLGWDVGNNYAQNAGEYVVEAKIEASENYEEWVSDSVSLVILQKESNVFWRFNGATEASYVYNATDQSDSVMAYILGAGSGDIENVIYLDVSILHRDAAVDPVLADKFLIAGEYDFSAEFADGAERIWLENNYALLNTVYGAVMEKYTVTLNWYYGDCGCSDGLYDPLVPCVYDGRTHSVAAVGVGLNGAEMVLSTSGNFHGLDAGEYIAYVTSIAEGNDSFSFDGQIYPLPYDLNYRLPTNTEFRWQIARRPIYLEVDEEATDLSKVYDDLYAFSFSSSYSETIDEGDGLISKRMTYVVAGGNYTGTESRLVYVLSNIIAGDGDVVNIGINSVMANDYSVNAISATITFGTIEFGSNQQNYYIAGDISGLMYVGSNLIVPRKIEVSMTENMYHVYNGLTFEKQFPFESDVYKVEELGKVEIIDVLTGLNVRELYRINGLNRFVGSFDIGGATTQGVYKVNAALSVEDQKGANNYEISFVSSDYEIRRRELKIVYENVLQSFRDELKPVSGVVDYEGSDLTDLEWNIEGFEAMTEAEKTSSLIEALRSLAAADGVSVLAENTWMDEAPAYTVYTLIDGNTDEKLKIDFNNENYTGNKPILQLTFIRVKDGEQYIFGVKDAADFGKMDSDISGLRTARQNYGIGVSPTYEQVADISGIDEKGGYVYIERNREFVFDAVYDGKGFVISDLFIVSNESNQAGLFGTVRNATVSNVTLQRVSLLARNTDYIGGIAGYAENSVIENVSVSGYIENDNAGGTVYGGMIIGEGLNTVVTNAKAAGYLQISALQGYAGGIVGNIYSVDSGISEIVGSVSFVEITVNFADNVNAVSGAGNGVLEDNVYLENSIFAAETVLSGTSEQGTAVTAESFLSGSAEGENAVVGNMVKQDIMRRYLLPGGSYDGEAVVITNYRQLCLLKAYGWADFVIQGKIYLPNSFEPSADGEFYSGEITYADAGGIYADVLSDTVYIVGTGQPVIIRKYE